jgi:hypothetical protein
MRNRLRDAAHRQHHDEQHDERHNGRVQLSECVVLE